MINITTAQLSRQSSIMVGMADALRDILKKRDSQNEPEEFAVIRKFVQDRFEVTPKLSTAKGSISIGVPNGAIASNLRFELYELNQKLNTKLRLIIKISR